MNYRELIRALPDLERSRDFSRFKEYSLTPFQELLTKVYSTLKSDKRPLRISVVGTNGKGSVSHFLSSLFEKSGLTVGLYTSPHLLIPNERIRVNGIPVTDEELDQGASILSGIHGFIPEDFSYFEIFTALSILCFSMNGCTVEVYEAGLGGRLDATKCTNPDAVVMCSIGMDHVEILGNSEMEILKEKLAISTNNTKYLYFHPQKNPVLETQVKKFSDEKRILSFLFDELMNVDYLEFNKNYSYFIYNDLLTKFPQEFKNCIPVSKERLKNINPPAGRMEKISLNGEIYFDTAHNPAAMESLINSIRNKFCDKKWVFILGCLPDKDQEGIIQKIMSSGFCDKLYIIVDPPFGQKEKILDTIIPTRILEAVQMIKETDSPVMITGSTRLYEIFYPRLRNQTTLNQE